MYLKFHKLLIVFLLILPFHIFAYDFESICQTYPCPISQTHNGNEISINCDDKNVQCNLFYINSIGQKAEIKNMPFVSRKAKLQWLSDNLFQIYETAGQNNSISLFINFKNMQNIVINNVFAVDAKRQWVAYNMFNAKVVEISPIFNLTKKINIVEDFSSGFPSTDVIMPSTQFDKQGNLSLVYYAGKNYVETTKIIPINSNYFN